MIISLWMCLNAKYPANGDDYLKCSKGRYLGKVHARMVKRGDPLICLACQGCKYADIMGDYLNKEDRGWR